MWWISYRGEGKAGVENIGVFEDDGTPRKEHPVLLDPSTDAEVLHIARGFALVGDDLYIANAWRKDSHVARYRRHGDTFHFAEMVVTTKDVAAMVHPFDVELGDDGRIYMSCQDTNTVIALMPKSRKPVPVAAHLRKRYPNGNFLPGTVVASSQGRLPEVHDSAHKINGFARAALNSCLDVVTWLAPDEDVSIAAAEGMRQCLGLLTTSLTFRGFTLQNEAGSVSGEVRRSAIRNVLTASLLHITDENKAPAEIVLAPEPDDRSLVLSLTLRPTDGEHDAHQRAVEDGLALRGGLLQRILQLLAPCHIGDDPHGGRAGVARVDRLA